MGLLYSFMQKIKVGAGKQKILRQSPVIAINLQSFLFECNRLLLDC